jgi:hypothetical protein
MYCSSCGTAVAPGLSFCTRCGTKLQAAGEGRATPTELFPESLIWAIVAVFVVGLGATIGLIAVMKNSGFNEGMINALALLSFLMMLGIEGVFIWLLLGRRNAEKKAGGTSALNEKPIHELGPARVLTDPIPGVTEHTTRSLDPVYSERPSK